MTRKRKQKRSKPAMVFTSAHTGQPITPDPAWLDFIEAYNEETRAKRRFLGPLPTESEWRQIWERTESEWRETEIKHLLAVAALVPAAVKGRKDKLTSAFYNWTDDD